MPDLLRFEWRKDEKGYEVVSLTPDMFDVIKFEREYHDEEIGTRRYDVPKIVPKAGGPKYIKAIIESGHLAKIENWLGMHEFFNWSDWVEAGSSFKSGPPQEFNWLIGKSGQLVPYALPISSFGIFREFAELQDHRAITDFASKYGSLDGKYAEPMSDWFQYVDTMSYLVTAWQDGLRDGDLRSLCESWNNMDKFLPEFELDASSNALHPPLRIVVPNLATAVEMQFAQTVSNDISLRHCEWCPTWFAYGPGTGKRKKGRYCSDACRKAAWNAKKLEEEGGRERSPK